MRAGLLAATALSTSVFFLVPGAFAQSSYDWGGAYVGVTVGGVGTASDITTDIDMDLDLGGNGALLGVTAGYNFVLNENFVVGIEGDASFATLEADGSNYDGTNSGLANEKLDSLLTLRGRAGFTSGPVFAYATLGIAGGEASYSTDIVDTGKFAGPSDPSSGSGFVTGVIGGAGMEIAANDNVSVKLEGLMYQMSSLEGTGDTGKGEYASEYNPSGLVVRTGVNLGF